MEVEAFRDALAKGQGRTMLALRAPDGPERYGETLIAGCVENLQFDRQMEANRAPYLFRMVEAAGLAERVRTAIMDALPTADEGWDRDLMIDLLEEFAARGDERAWDALLGIAEAGEERAQDNLASSGERGLAWVEANVLPGLSEEDRWRIWRWLPDEEADDRTETQRRLRTIRRADEARIASLPKGTRRRDLTPREFLDGLGTKAVRSSDGVDFARHASDEELVQAAERLLATDERRIRIVLLWVFRDRAFPLLLERLFALADDEERGPVVAKLLGGIDDPRVRAFALERLRWRPPDWDAPEMLRKCFHSGDEAAIWAVLPDLLGEELGTQHGFVLDLVALMFNHKAVDWKPFAEWVYERSPCAFCRGSAVRWMAERGTLPERIREEGTFDAEPEIRELCGADDPLTA